MRKLGDKCYIDMASKMVKNVEDQRLHLMTH